jgi:hypothetical protein
MVPLCVVWGKGSGEEEGPGGLVVEVPGWLVGWRVCVGERGQDRCEARCEVRGVRCEV